MKKFIKKTPFLLSGKQRLSHVAGSDLSLHEAAEHSAMHGSNDSLYKTQQVLSQQSSTLLQQSKAKHQAMLAQVR